VHTGPSQKYLSSEIKVTIIYVLEGQHEWFVEQAVHQEGIKYHPAYFDFHFSIYKSY